MWKLNLNLKFSFSSIELFYHQENKYFIKFVWFCHQANIQESENRILLYLLDDKTKLRLYKRSKSLLISLNSNIMTMLMQPLICWKLIPELYLKVTKLRLSSITNEEGKRFTVSFNFLRPFCANLYT